MERIYDQLVKRRNRDEYLRLEIYAPGAPMQPHRYVAYLRNAYDEILFYESHENADGLLSEMECLLQEADYHPLEEEPLELREAA